MNFRTVALKLLAAALLSVSAQAQQGSFAIAELFTSEGCSTCPRAEKFLSELYQSYRSVGRPVFVMAFHVDYWDEYGWIDPFGKGEFSKRQRNYGSIFKLKNVYTPQLIVNGSDEMVGFDPRAGTAIEDALGKPASVTIAIVPSVSGKKIEIHYTLSEIPPQSVINFALVERGLVREIWRGENSGRTLSHENVVRTFKVIKKPAIEGSVRIEPPSDLKIQNSSIIAYVQNADSMRILAATSVDLK